MKDMSSGLVEIIYFWSVLSTQCYKLMAWVKVMVKTTEKFRCKQNTSELIIIVIIMIDNFSSNEK